MRNKFLAGVMTVLLAFTPTINGLAEAQTVLPTIESIVMEQNGKRLAYPQLAGWTDGRVQQMINDDIILSADITSHMITFASLTPDSPWGLQVSYESYVSEQVVSFVISAEGKMPNNRQGQTNTPLTYHLSSGKPVKFADLFTDPEAAQQWLEEEALRTLGEEISDYEDSAALLPLPVERFSLDAYGITFWYEPEQFTTVGGKAGACRFDYAELQSLLLKDGLPAQMGMLNPEWTAEQQKEAILRTLEAGRLEQLPLALGDAMPQIIANYGLSRTPDEFPGGRYFVMEHPLLRSILLISDAMQNGYDHSVLEGIQLRRGAFCGLLIGDADREHWLSLLGEPEQVIEITENMAYDYNLPIGTCDIYTHGGNAVRFYADDNGLLAAVQFESN